MIELNCFIMKTNERWWRSAIYMKLNVKNYWLKWKNWYVWWIIIWLQQQHNNNDSAAQKIKAALETVKVIICFTFEWKRNETKIRIECSEQKSESSQSSNYGTATVLQFRAGIERLSIWMTTLSIGQLLTWNYTLTNWRTADSGKTKNMSSHLTINTKRSRFVEERNSLLLIQKLWRFLLKYISYKLCSHLIHISLKIVKF